MGIKTGNPRGRPKGASNKVTIARRAEIAKVAQQIEESLPDGAFTGDAHALLMTVYKNVAYPIDVRLDAAKAAVSYEKPRLQAVEMKAQIDASIEVSQIELVAPSVPSNDHAAH